MIDAFITIHFSNPSLIKYMQALRPGYLRIGGTLADKLRFVSGNNTNFYNEELCLPNEMCSPNIHPNFTLTGP